MSRFSLDYTFIVPSGKWKSRDDFSKDLATLFKARGFSTEVVEDGSEGGSKVTMILEVSEAVPGVPTAPEGAKVQMEKLKKATNVK